MLALRANTERGPWSTRQVFLLYFPVPNPDTAGTKNFRIILWKTSPLTRMKRVPITLGNETTTLVGRVVGATGRSPLLRVTRQKCIKNVGLRRLRA
uniref:Uncharacterized protein n=1 Tax=Candidatus Kentrum sp. LPFa TaxID=2126335 RepID=A0A450X5D9_9GAMM|nr:MAG: hypothetical protein BECKLPF1236C_GA0070990_1001326 [Candidatus Kentron sp. LPFa]